MTNTEIKLNPIEERLLDKWEDWIDWCREDLDDDDIKQIETEVLLFVDYVLPVNYPLCDWAFWTDGEEVLTKSEELAERLAKIIDIFGLSRTGYYDPEEDERNGETNDHTGYWCVTWD